MRLVSDSILLEWLPVKKIGSLFTSHYELDYYNSDSVKMFKVVKAGPGRRTKKGVLVPNEIHPGDNVIIDSRVAGRPEEYGNLFILKNPMVGVIAIIPLQRVGNPLAPASAPAPHPSPPVPPGSSSYQS